MSSSARTVLKVAARRSCKEHGANRAGIKEIKGDMECNSAIETATAWLGEFGAALALGEARIARLFASNCHWRDILALTWNLRTISGADGVANVMAQRNPGCNTGHCTA